MYRCQRRSGQSFEKEKIHAEKSAPPLRCLIRIGAFALASFLPVGWTQAQTTIGANLSGSIVFDDAPNAVLPVDFVFSSVSEPFVFSTRGTRSSNGAFTLDTLPNGNFLVSVIAQGRLQKVVPVDTTSGNVSNFSVTLEPGDMNGDNTCDVLDFGILVNAYGSDASNPLSGYDPNADVNYDGRVDVLDFGLLVNNYGTQGDVYASNLTVTPSASGLTLDWTSNPGGASYNVYRSTTPAGNGTLYASHITNTTYTDNAAVSGVAYYYQVSAVNQNGETQKSNEATGKVSPTPELQITNIANGATLSGEVQVVVSFTGFNPVSGMRLQLDDEYVSRSFPDQVVSGPGLVYFSLPTDSYSNGSHTFRVADSSGRSDVRTVVFSNVVSNFAYTDTFNVTTAGGSDDISNNCVVSGNLDVSQPWTVTVQTWDDTPVVLRTYSGNSSSINVTWDGNDSNGAEVDDGIYDIIVQAPDGLLSPLVQTPPQHHMVNKLRMSNCLLMIQTDNTIFPGDKTLPSSPSGPVAAAKYINLIVSKLKPYVGVDFTAISIVTVTDKTKPYYKDPKTKTTTRSNSLKTVLGFLSHRLSLLYIQCHGNKAPRPFFDFGGVTYYSKISAGGPAQGDYVVNMPDLVAGVNYGGNADPPALVWIDACNSAGGNVDGSPEQNRDDQFAQAFQSGANGYGTFLGWDGYVKCYSQHTCFDYYRDQIWTQIGAGYNFLTAFNRADSNTENVYGLGPYTGEASPTYRISSFGALQTGL